MKGADKSNARFALLIGEDELANGTVWLKDLETKEERTIPIEEIV